MKTVITSSLQVIAAVLITVGAIASAAPIPESSSEPAESVQNAEVVIEPSEEPKPLETAETSSEEQIEDPLPIVPAEEPAPQPVQSSQAPIGVTDRGGTGDCAAEIAKYDWPYGVALSVATAESGLRPGVVNNNPDTGDYSVGCFQVNLYGANATTRPSEEALRDAAVNVEWAYNNWRYNKRSFIGQWGVCRKVECS